MWRVDNSVDVLRRDHQTRRFIVTDRPIRQGEPNVGMEARVVPVERAEYDFWFESEGSATAHLVAKYKVLEVFKGDVHKDDILIVTDTCLDKPVPERQLGYPAVKDYCRGLIGLRLTGVNSRDGNPHIGPIVDVGYKPILTIICILH